MSAVGIKLEWPLLVGAADSDTMYEGVNLPDLLMIIGCRPIVNVRADFRIYLHTSAAGSKGTEQWDGAGCAGGHGSSQQRA